MAEETKPKIQRYLALDAYRGFIMLMLISHGFGFGELQGHPVYGGIAAWFEHAKWTGPVFWDMIQPGFMYIVGVAMPFAIAIRMQKGFTFQMEARHVAMRAIRLIVLSQILISISAGELRFQMINVLCQIALTYFLVFWIIQLRFRWQAVIAVALLVFHTALFYLFPGPNGPFSMDGNIGQVIDKMYLGHVYPGRWVGINFITSTVTTLFGAWTGMLLMSNRKPREVVKILAAASLGGWVLGMALSPWIPNAKRICTASFTLYSGGWVIFMMLLFYLVTEVLRVRTWTFPLVVLGANSIFIYSFSMVLHGWLNNAVAVFTGGFTFIGDLAPVAQSLAVVLVMWSLNYWLYKNKIFIKV